MSEITAAAILQLAEKIKASSLARKEQVWLALMCAARNRGRDQLTMEAAAHAADIGLKLFLDRFGEG